MEEFMKENKRAQKVHGAQFPWAIVFNFFIEWVSNVNSLVKPTITTNVYID